MPTESSGAFGRLARESVKESRIVQISGKMLIASSRTIVGAMNSQAIERSESPLARRATQSGDAEATRSASEGGGVISVMGYVTLDCHPERSEVPLRPFGPPPREAGEAGRGSRFARDDSGA